MSYTPTTWETGDTITAEKLNNMETGIAKEYNRVITASVSLTEGEFSIDSISHTPAQLEALLAAGVIPVIQAAITGAIPDVTVYNAIPYTQKVGDIYNFCGTMNIGNEVSVVSVGLIKSSDAEWSDSSTVITANLPYST